MKNHLQNRNGTYYFRRVVPRDIRPIIRTGAGKPRIEWVWSLNEKDHARAKRLIPQCLLKTNGWIDEARRKLAQAAVPRGAAIASSDDRTAAELREELDAASIESADFFARLDAENEHRAEIDPSFAEELRLRAARARERRRYEEAEENRQLLAELNAASGIGLLELYEHYAAQPGRHPKTVAQWRPYIANLADFLGDHNALNVTHAKLTEWRNYLRDKYRHKGKTLSAKTINGSYLGAASALFAWAKGDGIIPKNPMLEVTKVRAPKAAKTRSRAFTSEEALMILGATVAPNASSEGRHLRDAKRWCPWIMAYSGARVNEITQLRKEDVFVKDGIPVMRITPEAGTVKGRTFRLVPLHSHLVDQGFLKFVDGKGDGPLFYDPARRRSENAINRQANRLGSKLATWVRSLGITDVMPNHAWRHHFSAHAVRHGLDPRVTKAITGHSSTDVHEKNYLTDLPDFVDVLSRELEKVPRFEVPV